MKVGDLIRVKECLTITGNKPIKDCGCLLCSQNSSRVGLVMSKNIVPKTLDVPFWEVLFDVGSWNLHQSDIDGGEVEVISETS